METIKLLVATDPTYYGPNAGPEDVQEYATFAYEYLLRNGYEHVEIEFVSNYSGMDDAQSALVRSGPRTGTRPRHCAPGAASSTAASPCDISQGRGRSNLLATPAIP
jgi:hypothetical protein